MFPIIEEKLLQELYQNITTKLNIILKNPVIGDPDDSCNIKVHILNSLKLNSRW